MNDNKDFISHEIHLPNDPSINVLNQNIKLKQSRKDQRKQKNKKSHFKIILWFLGLIVLNVLFQVIGYYNYGYYSSFEFNWSGCFWLTVAYCIFSLLISALSDRAKNPKMYEAIDKARIEARKKQLEELQKQAAEKDKKFNPKCPTCGSTNIRHISSTERGINAVMFGFFGNKRKCQFECLNPNCRYRW